MSHFSMCKNTNHRNTDHWGQESSVRLVPSGQYFDDSRHLSTQSIVTDATNSCGLQWPILSQNRRLLVWMQNYALICYMVSCKWKQMSSRLCKRWPLWGSTCPCKLVHFWKPRFKLELVCELDIAENVFPLFCFHFYIYIYIYFHISYYINTLFSFALFSHLKYCFILPHTLFLSFFKNVVLTFPKWLSTHSYKSVYKQDWSHFRITCVLKWASICQQTLILWIKKHVQYKRWFIYSNQTLRMITNDTKFVDPLFVGRVAFHTTAIYLSQVGDALLGYNLRYLQTTDNPAVGSVNYFPPFFHFRGFLN